MVTGSLGLVIDGHVADVVFAVLLLDGVETVAIIDLAQAERLRVEGLDPTRNLAGRLCRRGSGPAVGRTLVDDR